jgi:threonyl-tRNA synthetase
LGIIPIKAFHNEYCNKLVKSLKNAGFRVKSDNDDTNMRNKIKNFELEKIPYMLIVGDKEMQADSFTVRSRKEGDLGLMNIEKLYDYLKKDIDMGKPKCI